MNCPGDVPCVEAGFLQDFSYRAASRRIPLNGGIDLTYRCNLGCLHCYASDSNGCSLDSGNDEMSTQELFSVIDQIVDAGCLFLLLTGGEPLMRPDFPFIYERCRKKGLLVTIFTNGTLVDHEIVRLFDEFPPRSVEISIYGCTDNTHDRITGVSGSFRDCIRGVNLLKDAGVPVTLKTVLMNLNQDEFQGIEKIARDMGVKFRMDAMIFPCLDNDPSPMDYRVAPLIAVEKEMESRERRDAWLRYAKRVGNHSGSVAKYDCGAGITTFHIDPYGNLYSCLMARKISYSLRTGDFSYGWQNVIPGIRDGKPSGSECSNCKYRGLCSYCPGTFELEKDRGTRYHDYVCEVARLRNEHLCVF